MKKFNIMGTKFRNRLKGYDNMISIVSGLVNFKLMYNEDYNPMGFVG